MRDRIFPKGLFAAAVLALSLGAIAQGQKAAGSSAAASQPSAASPGAADRNFAAKAAAGGLAEVEMAKLAQQRASAAPVKEFADRMARDHGKANDELKALADAKGISLPSDADKAAKRDIDKLGKLSGAAFDREYMKHMVVDHRGTIRAFEAEEKAGKDAELKGFAAKTLPTIREHLKMAQAIKPGAASVGGAASGAASASKQ